MILHLSLLILAIAGGAISLYFTFVYAGKIPPGHWLVPPFCRMDDSSCSYVIHTREARIFGIPNVVAGLLFYGILGIFVLSPTFEYTETIKMLLLTGSAVSVLLGIYLVYALFVTLKVRCTLCIIAHGINLAIFSLLLAYP
jgi:uncharacterized membrane protein